MYEDLQSQIRNWVEVNCDAFLDDQTPGIELTYSNYFHPTAMNAYQQVVMWPGTKSYILQAVIMRHIYDYILRLPFPLWLSTEEHRYLTVLEENLSAKSIISKPT
jgi:hypothetical protein